MRSESSHTNVVDVVGNTWALAIPCNHKYQLPTPLLHTHLMNPLRFHLRFSMFAPRSSKIHGCLSMIVGFRKRNIMKIPSGVCQDTVWSVWSVCSQFSFPSFTDQPSSPILKMSFLRCLNVFLTICFPPVGRKTDPHSLRGAMSTPNLRGCWFQAVAKVLSAQIRMGGFCGSSRFMNGWTWTSPKTWGGFPKLGVPENVGLPLFQCCFLKMDSKPIFRFWTSPKIIDRIDSRIF